MVSHKLLTVLILAGLAALIAGLFLTWCPPDACRVLHIHTHTISRLDEYRQYLADEAAFHTLHHSRAVRLDCSALRDEVVTALQTGQLTVGTNQPKGDQKRSPQGVSMRAWHQGRLLHLANPTAEDHQESNAWAAGVRAGVAGQQRQELSFLPHLFGGLILHADHKQTPIVFFSAHPCI